MTQPEPGTDPGTGPGTEPDPGHAARQEPEPDWKRRRRLAEVFGDTLPDTTADERGSGAPAGRESADEAWLRAQVPPHHGG